MERDPRFDGLDIFVVMVAKLLPGDILLTRNRNDDVIKHVASSKAISFFSKGLFSHALICTYPPTFIEAIPGPVVNVSMASCFAFDLSNVRMLRYKDAEVAKRAASLAALRVGQPYSILNAYASVRRNSLIPIDDEGIICSALVAAAYIDAGASEFASLDLGRCTPATLEHLECLTDVTAHIFRKILSPPNAEGMTALDGRKQDRASSKQAELLGQYFEKTKKKVFALQQQIAGCPKPVNFFGALGFVDRLLEVAVTSNFPLETPMFAQARELDEELLALVNNGELQGVLDDLKAIDDETHQRIIVESFESNPDLDIDHLQDLLRVTIDLIEDRMKPHRRPFSAALQAWQSIQGQALTFYQSRREILTEVLGRLGYALPPNSN